MTGKSAPATIPYGSWPSPISAADVASGQRLFSFPIIIGTDVWWQQRVPAEGARVTVVRHGADGQTRSLLPAPWNARTRVHEYGGLSYLPVPAGTGSGQAAGPAPGGTGQAGNVRVRPAGSGGGGQNGGGSGGGAIVFANYLDQRLYLVTESAAGAGDPQPLTPVPDGVPASPSLRYADFTLSPDGSEIWCVREQHAGGKVRRAIVAVPLDGSAAANPAVVRELVTGSDFFAFPTASPDGRRLAWICWNHPRMPWDGTELRVAEIRDGTVGKGWLIKGGVQESVLAPSWRDRSSLYLVSDWPGWWNLYQVNLSSEPTQAMYPAEEEFAYPLWQLGELPYAKLSDGTLAVLHGTGGMRLGLLDPESGELTDVDTKFPVFTSGLSGYGVQIVGIAGGPKSALSVVRVNLSTGKTEVLARETEEVPPAGYLPVPRTLELEGRFGRSVHALVYAPSNPEAKGPEGERPPFVVWAHGGPTAQALPLLDTEKAYFTSRGIGVIDVNYGGSTGYGRSYRERLRQQWGVVDVEDVIGAALALAEAGEADRDRLAIRGGSAGGWTALAAVTTQAEERRVFSAAASYYGVAGLAEFVSQTHDFESHYLDGLIGPLPGFQAVYSERSPAGHVSEYTCPVLLLQGLEDPVVPPTQSRQMAADLAAHGIRHALLEFEGESHGFRRVETIITCLEAELAFYGQILGFKPPGVKPVPLLGGKPEEQERAGPQGKARPQQAGTGSQEDAGPKPSAGGTQPQAADPRRPAPGTGEPGPGSPKAGPGSGKPAAGSGKGGHAPGTGGADSGKGGSAANGAAATADNGAESSPQPASSRKGRLGSRRGAASRREAQQARKGGSG